MRSAVIGIIFFCATHFAPGQSMFRGDPAHTGVYAGTAPRQFHRIKWKFTTGDRVFSSPVASGKMLYFTGDDGNIYAVDAENGRQVWNAQLLARRLPRPQWRAAPFMSAATMGDSMRSMRRAVR
jgi:hypothetical protein